MNKYQFILTLMNACLDAKDNQQDLTNTFNRLLSYSIENFTDPRTFKDPLNLYVSTCMANQKTISVSYELLNATKEILKHGNLAVDYRFDKSLCWTDTELLSLLNRSIPRFKEPVFPIAVIKYLFIKCKNINENVIKGCDIGEFHKRYGTLIHLAAHEF